MKKLFILAIVIAALGLSVTAQKPNVVYILTDQWRAEAFGYAGDVNVKTPRLDKFASEAVNFKNAVSACPVCTPHRASLLTGKFPTSTGMFLNDLHLPDDELCMAEIFKAAGYSTAYLGKWHLDGHGRFNNVAPERRQGFDYWKALECSHDYNHMAYYENDDSEIKYWDGYSPFALSEEAQKYVSRHAGDDDPFLLFVSIAAPHFPHATAPEEYKALYPEDEIVTDSNVPDELVAKVRKELNGYYAHCSAVDDAVGDLLDKMKALGLMENTIVVFSSDHGEMMGSHGARPKSKQVAWDESVHVPFLIKTPFNADGGAIVNAPITTPDILATLLGLADVDIPETVEGEDLSWLVKSPDPEYDRAALFMNVCPFGNEYHYDEYRGIRTKQYTYVCSPDGAMMLFDDIVDPEQLNNLADQKEFARVQKSLNKKLKAQLKKIGDKNFKHRDYYLDKWNLKLNGGKVIDYSGFTKGEGVVQTPQLSKNGK